MDCLNRETLKEYFLTPAASRTARTPPPAIIPVPFLAGFKRTFTAIEISKYGWGIVSPASETAALTFLLVQFLYESHPEPFELSHSHNQHFLFGLQLQQGPQS